MNASTISIITQDKKVILVKVKHEVTYTVPPKPSECVDKALGTLKSMAGEYPAEMQAAQRAKFVRRIRNKNCHRGVTEE